MSNPFSGATAQDALSLTCSDELLANSIADFLAAREEKAQTQMTVLIQLLDAAEQEQLDKVGDLLLQLNGQVAYFTAEGEQIMLNYADLGRAIADQYYDAEDQVVQCLDASGQLVSVAVDDVMTQVQESIVGIECGVAAAQTLCESYYNSSIDSVSNFASRIQLKVGDCSDAAIAYGQSICSQLGGNAISVRDKCMGVLKSIGAYAYDAFSADTIGPPPCQLTDITGQNVYTALVADIPATVTTVVEGVKEAGRAVFGFIDNLFGGAITKTATTIKQTTQRLTTTLDAFTTSDEEGLPPVVGNVSTTFTLTSYQLGSSIFGSKLSTNHYLKMETPGADVYCWKVANGDAYLSFYWKPIPDNIASKLSFSYSTVSASFCTVVPWDAYAAELAAMRSNQWAAITSEAEMARALLEAKFQTFRYFAQIFEDGRPVAASDAFFFPKLFTNSCSVIPGDVNNYNNRDLALLIRGTMNDVWGNFEDFIAGKLPSTIHSTVGLYLLEWFFNDERFGCYMRTTDIPNGMYSVTTDTELRQTLVNLYIGMKVTQLAILAAVFLKTVKTAAFTANNRAAALTRAAFGDGQNVPSSYALGLVRKANKKAALLNGIMSVASGSVKSLLANSLGAVKTAVVASVNAVTSAVRGITGDGPDPVESPDLSVLLHAITG